MIGEDDKKEESPSKLHWKASRVKYVLPTDPNGGDWVMGLGEESAIGR